MLGNLKRREVKDVNANKVEQMGWVTGYQYGRNLKAYQMIVLPSGQHATLGPFQAQADRIQNRTDINRMKTATKQQTPTGQACQDGQGLATDM